MPGGSGSDSRVCGNMLCSEVEKALARIPDQTPEKTPPTEYMCDPDLSFTDDHVLRSGRIFE